jgi:hypothetical protein
VYIYVSKKAKTNYKLEWREYITVKIKHIVPNRF